MSSLREGLARRVRLQFRLWSPFYDSAFFQRGYYLRVQRRLLEALGDEPARSVLDVGCGTGQLLRTLAHRWPHARLVGLDLSPDMLAHARTKDYGSARVELTEGSVYDMPFEDGTFDLVTNTISSHFYKDIEPALDEVVRVLAPGGRFATASLTNGPLRLVQRELRGVQAVYRSPARLRAALEGAGLTIERERRLTWPAWLFVCRRPAH